MAVKIKNLEKVAKIYTSQQYIYKDISLDVNVSQIITPGSKKAIPGNDIQADFDIAAIRNSLQNLFNTLPGQRFLFPEYGLDLNQFLFLPVTENTARAIGERMLSVINTYEQRVVVQGIRVAIDPDNNQYNISITVQLPTLNRVTTLDGVLNTRSQSFIFLPTTRNQ